MTADVKELNGRLFLHMTNMTQLEIDQLRLSFTKEPKDAWIKQKTNAYSVTHTEFFNQFGLLPVGLWQELIEVCRQYGFPLTFTQLFSELFDVRLTQEDFYGYVRTIFMDAVNDKGEPVTPMPYQLKGVYNMLYCRRACAEVSTSGGKTLMSYILFKFLLDVKKIRRMLYIVPNKNLATQSVEKYDQYEGWIKGRHEWTSGVLMSQMRKAQKEMVDKCTILFGTFQSLCNKNADFFKDFDVVFCDEAHHGGTDSIKSIFRKTVHAKYVFGMTGTMMKENTYERYQLESFIGPLCYRLTSFDLINKENFATPIFIFDMVLKNYMPIENVKALYELRRDKAKEDPQAGARILKLEQEMVNADENRLRYISRLACRCKNNTLILFNDVKDGKGYGRKIADFLKDITDRNVYYADGNTDTETRDYYKSQMESDTSGRTIIVGSLGVFSEGIDVANLWNIILAQSVKSEFIVRQMLGRGMRRYKGKDKVIIFDICDDLKYGDDEAAKEKPQLRQNYLWKHHLERDKIYKENGFPVSSYKVQFDYNGENYEVKG